MESMVNKKFNNYNELCEYFGISNDKKLKYKHMIVFGLYFEYIKEKHKIIITKELKEYTLELFLNDIEKITKKEAKICCVDGCFEKYRSLGYCNRHYAQFKKNGYILKDKIQKCIVCGEDSENKTDGYCRFHNKQIKKYGYIKYIEKEYQHIIVENGYATIKNKYGYEIFIDIEDVEKCKKYNWGIDKNLSYVRSFIDGKDVKLHNYIMNTPEGYEVDHINRNPLDNRKCNLRICTIEENKRNRGLMKNNKSGIIGVIFYSRLQKWHSYITVNKKTISLGYYLNKDEAIIARLKAEKEYFKEYSPQKNLFDVYGI